jgi:hypothetical protein
MPLARRTIVSPRLVVVIALVAAAVAGCGDGEVPTVQYEGRDVLELRPAPCDDNDACPAYAVLVGREVYIIQHRFGVDAEAVGDVHAASGDEPAFDVSRALLIDGVPPNMALAAELGGQWVLMAGPDLRRPESEDYPDAIERLCETVSPPDDLSGCE